MPQYIAVIRLCFRLLIGYVIRLAKVIIGTPKACWWFIPKHESGDIVRALRERFLMGATNDIKYQPLPGPTWIRLLEVEAGSSSAVIRCSLLHCDLAAAPSYTALSYTWKEDPTWFRATYITIRNFVEDLRRGEKLRIRSTQRTEIINSKIIICNHQIIKIHPNLYNALVQLRRRRPGKYWIDAICINQRYDTVEIEAPNVHTRLL